MYLRASRLDLDNYNNDTNEGCHTTSMAGTWMAVVHGFGGLRVRNNKLILAPFIPENWSSCSFKIMFRGALLNIKVTKTLLGIRNENDSGVNLSVFNIDYFLSAKGSLQITLQ